MQLRRALAAGVTAAAATLGMTTPHPAAARGVGDQVVRGLGDVATQRERPGFLDTRTGGIGAGRATLSPQEAREVDAAARGLRRSTDVGALDVEVDPGTGTPSHLAAIDGFLTPASGRAPEAIVRGYLRDNATTLGLTRADLSTFRLREAHTDSLGITHLSYEQLSRGIRVFGNGLKAQLTGSGELISLQGAPISDLDSLTAGLPTRPAMSAEAARSTAADDVGGEPDDAASARSGTSAQTSMWSNGDRADLVWFVDGDSASLAWSTYTQAGGSLTYSHVVGVDGDILYRNDLVDFAQPAGRARVYDHHPGAARGGSARIVDLVREGWVDRSASWLRGPNVSAWADLDDDDVVDSREKTPVPGNGARGQFVLQEFDDNAACSARYVCTWNPEEAYSWRANKKADVTNAFYLANRFHDWLARPAIGFDAAGGNFERRDGDPVLLHALDGADTDNGLPDANHTNNANMSTPPDGSPPVMQMYLLHQPGQPNSVDPFLPTSTSFEAGTVYHEYTHGLSNRLVTDAGGNSTLNSIQAGAMGEAWSDYYAMDYLVHKGFVRDTRRDGELRDGDYAFAGTGGWRSQAIDCDVDSLAATCKRLEGGRGGYTYGDFPTIGGAPQVHASGEVFTQTLWDIREALGSVPTSRLVTAGMRLSAPDPTMLDMRNAILQADKAINDSRNTTRLWKLFAARGMGWFAGAVDGGDAFPAESFALPPGAGLPRGAVAGALIDDLTGEPIDGIRVAISGHGDRYAATSEADGTFVIGNVLAGTYAKLTVGGHGYDGFTRRVTVEPGRQTTIRGQLRRDWAASSGGGQVVDFTGPDSTLFGCGPEQAIDLSQGTGWSSSTGNDEEPTGTPVPKRVDIALPVPIDITADTGTGETAFRVDPTNTCGDAGSSATDEYRIEVSTDGSTWTEVADGAFGSIDDPDSKGRYFEVASDLTVRGVTHVRFWMDSPQVPDIAANCPDGGYGGCTYMDLTEIQVYGLPTN